MSAAPDHLQRENVEQQLAESCRMLRRIAETSPDVIFIFDLEAGQTTYVSPPNQRLTGYSPEQIADLGEQAMTLLIHPDDLPRVRTHLQRHRRMTEGEIFEITYRSRDREGNYRWMVARTAAFARAETGEVRQIIGIARDIDERKRAEEALRATEERLRSVSESGFTSIAFFDINGAIIDANDSFLAMVGYSRDELRRGIVRWDQLTPPEWKARTEQALAEFRETGRISPYEKEYFRRDGSRFWGLFGGARLRESKQGVAFVIDITERKQAEVALRESERRLQLAVELARLALYDWDATTDVLRSDATLKAMWGSPPDAAIHYGAFLAAIHPDDQAAATAAVARATDPRGDGRYEAEFRVIGLGDGIERWVGTRGQAFFSDGRLTRFIGTALDLTEQKHTQDLLEKTVAQRTASLREAVQQLEEFSYSVSHDLRSPLRVMKGYAEALLDDYGDALDERGRHYLERIARASDRLDRLTLDVLSYSRTSRSDISLQPIDLDRLVTDALREYQQTETPWREITVMHPLLPVLGHESLLTQCVANLVSNALKFTRPDVALNVRIWTEKVAEGVRLWIEDNGIGIPPAHQERIFGLFERLHTSDVYEGTGVGLALVRKAMERMGGAVGVESDGKTGSRFWLQLRAAE